MKKATILLILVAALTSSVGAQDSFKWVYWEGAEPINWLDNGVPKGIEVEIVQRIMDRLGIKVVHAFYPWARCQKMVEAGEADGMMTTPSPARFGYAVFGKEIALPNFWTIWVKKTNAAMIDQIRGFRKLEDLKPYRLVDFRGNGWKDAYMKASEGYRISEVDSLAQLPLVIVNDRYDFLINSSNWMNWMSRKEGVYDQLEEIQLDLPNTQFHFVMMAGRKSPWVDRGIIKAMDQELRKMKASGEWVEILKKYNDPHGFGRPFKTQLLTDQYYTDYSKYRPYRPN